MEQEIKFYKHKDIFCFANTNTISSKHKVNTNTKQNRIKKGNTKTYGEISVKFKVSPRYVGRVCGENRHILLVPCHRVIRSDGSLGGYSAKGGFMLKKRLLDFEMRKVK